MNEHLKVDPAARARLASVQTARQMAGLYSALTTLSEVVSGLIAQPRFAHRPDKDNEAGKYLESLGERLAADFEELVLRATERVQTRISDCDRDELDRILLAYDVRCNEPASEIAATAAALAINASRVHRAKMFLEQEEQAA
jgi:hypothetical protein